MKENLGFADAAAIVYRTRGSSGEYTIVVGVEDSTRVRYRPTGIETVVLPETWQNLKALVDENMGLVTAAFGQVWDLVDGADSELDRGLAHEVLARDSSASARAVATLMLGNFIDDETSWHGLVGSLIDPVARVTTAAQSTLSGLMRQELDPVEWSGARTTLLAIFRGTNPFAFRDTLRLLIATDVDPEVGQQLVRESPDLLLAHVGAEHEFSRALAIAFLRSVSGEDLARMSRLGQHGSTVRRTKARPPLQSWTLRSGSRPDFLGPPRAERCSTAFPQGSCSDAESGRHVMTTMSRTRTA